MEEKATWGRKSETPVGGIFKGGTQLWQLIARFEPEDDPVWELWKDTNPGAVHPFAIQTHSPKKDDHDQAAHRANQVYCWNEARAKQVFRSLVEL